MKGMSYYILDQYKIVMDICENSIANIIIDKVNLKIFYYVHATKMYWNRLYLIPSCFAVNLLKKMSAE